MKGDLLTKHFLKALSLLLVQMANGQPASLPGEIPIQSAAITTLHVEGYPDFMTADSLGVWITNKDRVQKMVWTDARPLRSIDIANPCGVMRVAYGSLWVASCDKKS